MNHSDQHIKNYAELVVLSAPALFSYIYDMKGEELVTWLMKYIRDEDSAIHTSYIVSDIRDNNVRGMILYLPAEQLKKLSKKEIPIIRKNIDGLGQFLIYMIKWSKNYLRYTLNSSCILYFQE